MRKQKIVHPRMLTIPDDFIPLLPIEFEEVYPNGIFAFNVEKLLPYVEEHKSELVLESVSVSYWRRDSGLSDGYVELADLSKPLILAEISPDRLAIDPSIDSSAWGSRGYNLIDGHHRIEKAFRNGIEYLPAYLLPMEHHIRFMFRGYQQYADYWNRKLMEYAADQQR